MQKKETKVQYLSLLSREPKPKRIQIKHKWCSIACYLQMLVVSECYLQGAQSHARTMLHYTLYFNTHCLTPPVSVVTGDLGTVEELIPYLNLTLTLTLTLTNSHITFTAFTKATFIP